MNENLDIKRKPFRIYSEFGENIDLKNALNTIAKELHFEIYFGDGWDFIATNFDIAILSRSYLNPAAWEFYLNMGLEDPFSKTSVILVDKHPLQQFPPFYNIDQIDFSSKGGIKRITERVKDTYRSSNRRQSV